MQKSELVKIIAAYSYTRKWRARRALKKLVLVIREELKRGGEVQLSGLGTFKMVDCKGWITRGFDNGDPVRVGEGRKISFRASRAFKKAVKNDPSW